MHAQKHSTALFGFWLFSHSIIEQYLGFKYSSSLSQWFVLLSSAVTESDQVNSGDFGMLYAQNNQKPASLHFFLKGYFTQIRKLVPFLTLLSCYSNSYAFFLLQTYKERFCCIFMHTVVLHTVKSYCIVTRSCQTSERTKKYLKISLYDKLSFYISHRFLQFPILQDEKKNKKTSSIKFCIYVSDNYY